MNSDRRIQMPSLKIEDRANKSCSPSLINSARKISSSQAISKSQFSKKLIANDDKNGISQSSSKSHQNLPSPQCEKFNSLLNQINSALTDDSEQTKELVKNIDKRVSAINKKFDTSKQDKEMDKIMFSQNEKNSMIKNFNLSVDNMYTNKGIGMKFFKDKILRQGSELE